MSLLERAFELVKNEYGIKEGDVFKLKGVIKKMVQYGARDTAITD